jgi:hypothetical protein
MKQRLLPLLSMVLVMFVAVAAQAQPRRSTVRCESTNNHYRECTFSGFGAVSMGRQLSSVACQQGRSWGVKNDNVIWVDRGCRADFLVVDRPNRGYGNNNRDARRMDRQDARRGARTNRVATVVCESQNNRRNRCATDTSFGVQITRQLSNGSCVQGRDWGYDTSGIWVDHGCRAEFGVNR